jgi:hypothetical protein
MHKVTSLFLLLMISTEPYNIYALNNRMTGNGDSNRSSSSLGNYDDNDDNNERKRNQPAATTPQSVDGSKTTIYLASSSLAS